MSTVKHTPGPWARHPSYPWIIKQDLRPIAEAEDGVTVCNTTAHESSGFFPTPGEGRANACLIAAAPELLDALEELIDIVEDAIAQRSAKDLDSFTLQPAKALVAKAKGTSC